MALPVILANQRLAEPRGIKGCIFGKSGIGKTTLLWTLPQETTLFFDLEAGDLAVEGWRGHTLRPRTWKDCRDYAVFICGPNPALRDDQPYSQKHFNDVCERFGNPSSLNRYETVFIDSITVAARLCFQWCKGDDQFFNAKTKKTDTRGAYGLHGQEMIAWLTHLQHTPNKNIWFVGILDKKTDEFHHQSYHPQIEGNKTGLELPGIVDQVITMADITVTEGTTESKFSRVFVCHTLNPCGYPAKDRSGRLNLLEEPHLGRLMEKIRRPLHDRLATLIFSCPKPSNPQQQGD